MNPNEYVVTTNLIKTYYINIRHKETGIEVNGKGDHDYKLECQLLEKLREKLEERDVSRRTD